MLAHFHQQAVDILEVYSTYKVSLEQIKSLLKGEKIVDRGEALAFEPAEFLNSSEIMACLETFKNTPMGQALKLIYAHLAALGADQIFTRATQATAQGLVLLAAKTIFNHILSTDLENSRDTYDSLMTRRGENGTVSGIINTIKLLGAARNTAITWEISFDSINFQISVPCKLTDREIQMFKIYLEKAVEDPQSAQRVFEEAKEQGLTLDLSLLRSLAQLKQMTGNTAKIGYYIGSNNIHYWLTTPIVRAKVPAAPKPPEQSEPDQKTPLVHFDKSKANDPTHLAEVMVSNKNNAPILAQVLEALHAILEEEAMLADPEIPGDLEAFIAPVVAKMTETPGFSSQPASVALLLESLQLIEEKYDFKLLTGQTLRSELNRHHDQKKLSEIASGIEPREDNSEAVLSLINQVVHYEKMPPAEFTQIINETTLLPEIAKNP